MSSAPTPLHPRLRYNLSGVEEQKNAVETAISRGRLHHAWLLVGPQGVGKASFAYQFARRLLGARQGAAPSGGLCCAQDDPVCRMIAAQSHPDLLVLERWTEANPNRKFIPVDEARRLPEFFSKTPVMAEYRVAIVDSADDLNINASNAVLKTLEEPSGHGVLLLVSHAPGQLLPTIRSRCRRLSFTPWPTQKLADFLVEQLRLPDEDALRLAEMSVGAPGRSLALASQGVLELDDMLGEILEQLPVSDGSRLLAMAESLRGGEGQGRFDLIMERLASRLQSTAVTLARSGATVSAERCGQAWSRVSAVSNAAEALNMDRPDVFWSLITDLKRMAQSTPLSN